MQYRYKSITQLSETIQSVLVEMDYSPLKGLTTKNQKEQMEVIHSLQNSIVEHLESAMPEIWEKEYHPREGVKDAIDIYGNTPIGHIVIELDKPRADQVAKKMISRFSFFDNAPMLYISLCYPGTASMNPQECKKYFNYGRNVLQQMHPESQLIGIIIQTQTFKPEFYDRTR